MCVTNIIAIHPTVVETFYSKPHANFMVALEEKDDHLIL